MTLLSVVIPSYNHARYIGQALRSVLTQDYPALELVIIDDGSSDGSDEVIRAAIADAGPVRVTYERQANAGAHAAIMRGLSLARGEALTVLNSDDHYEPSRLRLIMEAAAGRGEFLAFSRVRLIDENGATLPPDAPLQGWYDKALRDAAHCPTVGFALLRNNISVTSGNLVFSRTLYEKVGGFRHFRMCHDWDFLMRAVHHVEPVYLQQPLIAYRYHPTNTLRSTAHLELDEGTEAFNDYVALGLAQVPPNPLAPSWAHWPRYFPFFIDRYSSWFSREPMQRFLRGAPPRRAPGGADAWLDAARLGLPTGEFLTEAAAARDAFALLREAALAGTGP